MKARVLDGLPGAPARLARHAAVLVLALLLGAGLGGCGGGSSSSLAANQMRVSVEPDAQIQAIDPGAASVDLPYVSVVVCDASDHCVTVPYVQLDTGSTGLRLRAKALAGLELRPIRLSDGGQLDTCEDFLSGYAWGSVERATVELGREAPIAVPIEVYGSGGPAPAVPAYCASLGNNSGSLLGIGANGVLGVDGVQSFGAPYWDCQGNACTQLSALPKGDDVSNPVSYLGDYDNNGLILTLPSIPASGAAMAQGTLTFGLDTRDDNLTTGFAAIPADSNVDIGVTVQGQDYPYSTIDSGSNGYFGPLNLPYDSASLSFTPATPQVLPMTLSSGQGALPSVAWSTSIDIGNGLALQNGGSFALDDVGAYSDTPGTFLLGLPYFFGRSIAYGMAGMPSGLGVGPIIGVLRP